jgi:hypothetical protein
MTNVNDEQFRQRFDRRRHNRGLNAETIVAAVYMATGHRILGRRFRTPVGEIDLIALKKNRVAFIEVKRRPTSETRRTQLLSPRGGVSAGRRICGWREIRAFRATMSALTLSSLFPGAPIITPDAL